MKSASVRILTGFRGLSKTIWAGWLRGTLGFFVHVPGLLLLLVGLYYVLRILNNLREDTTTITNVAFGVLATLSALSFSCARTIQGPEEDKDGFTFAGERFLHAGIMMLVASFLKYAALSAVNEETTAAGIGEFAVRVVGFLVALLFLYALTSGHSGYLVVNRLLWKRLPRHPKWDDIA